MRLEQSGDFPRQPSVEFSVSAKRPSAFCLNLFVPSWAESVEVFVNGEKQAVAARSSSYIGISRKWNDGDHVRLNFRYGFRLRSMPDKDAMFAIFYGPMMLAFETNGEVILTGDKREVLDGLSVSEESGMRFLLRNGGNNYTLRPFFDIDGESYGVYATIRNY